MRWKIFIILIFILLFTNVSAEVKSIAPVMTGACVTLPQAYANSTFHTISTIQFPDKTLQIINQKMTALGNGYFNYTFCNNTQNGNYIVNGIGDVDGTNQTWQFDYDVNPLGKTFTTSQAIIYFLIFFVSMILFAISLVFGIFLPISNNKDEMTGYVLAVNNLKYLKMFSWAVSYILLMLLTYIGWQMCFGYLDLLILGTLFQIAFTILLVCVLPFFILIVYLFISNWVHDSKVADALVRGLHFR